MVSAQCIFFKHVGECLDQGICEGQQWKLSRLIVGKYSGHGRLSVLLFSSLLSSSLCYRGSRRCRRLRQVRHQPC
jgi:hypothetical protein